MNLKPVVSLLFTCLIASASAQTPQPPAANDAPPAPTGRVAPRDGRSPRGPEPQRMMHDVRSTRPEDRNPGSRVGPRGMWWKNPDVIQKLNLSDDQQKKMDGIFQQSRIQLIDLKANVEKQEVILEPMLDANPPDTNKVLAQIDHVAQARAELEKANAKMLLGIRGVLTADQWTKLHAEQHNRHMMPGGKEGPGEPRGGGMMGGEPGGHREFRFAAPDGPPEPLPTPPGL